MARPPERVVAHVDLDEAEPGETFRQPVRIDGAVHIVDVQRRELWTRDAVVRDEETATCNTRRTSANNRS